MLCFAAASPVRAEGAEAAARRQGEHLGSALTVTGTDARADVVKPGAATPGAATAAPAAIIPPPAAPAEGPKPAQPGLGGELEEELARLHKLEAELKAVESAPLPGGGQEGSLPATKPQEEKPAPSAAEVPKEPVKGLEEEFANALYALGKYDAAGAVYRKLLESKPKADVQEWARFQIANCARRAGDLPAAATAYEELLTTSPTCTWAPEATGGRTRSSGACSGTRPPRSRQPRERALSPGTPFAIPSCEFLNDPNPLKKSTRCTFFRQRSRKLMGHGGAKSQGTTVELPFPVS